MLLHSDSLLLEHARDHAERLRAEARTRARLAHGRPSRPAPARSALAGGLARLARFLGALAEDLDPQVARPRWQPRL
jgi:hypothetical protein